MLKVNNKNTRTTSLSNNGSIVDFEQVNVSWGLYHLISMFEIKVSFNIVKYIMKLTTLFLSLSWDLKHSHVETY